MARSAPSRRETIARTVRTGIAGVAGSGFALAVRPDYRPSYRAADAADGWSRLVAWLRANGVTP
jgi:hypothetical protein